MTILAFTGLVLSYGNALFSLLLCKFVVNPKKTYGNDR